MDQDHFNDYYEILQVSPSADRETIEKIFRLLAKRYHPDNGGTGDSARFNELVEAYKVLSNPEKRAAYDLQYDGIHTQKWKLRSETSTFEGPEDGKALRHGILSVLYSARRQNSTNPGVGILYLEQVLGCPREVMEFHLWYVKEKGWVQRTDNGSFAITAAGVDALESNGSPLRKDRLLEGRSE